MEIFNIIKDVYIFVKNLFCRKKEGGGDGGKAINLGSDGIARGGKGGAGGEKFGPGGRGGHALNIGGKGRAEGGEGGEGK